MLKCLTVLALVLFMGSCSEEPNAVLMNEDKAIDLKSGSSIWDGVIGKVENGQYIITIPIADLKKDFETQLARQGNPVALNSFQIVDIVSQDGSATTPVIIGSNGNGVSIARFLKKNTATMEFFTDRSFNSKYTTCTGCATGCHLTFAHIDGKKIPYCDEAGCYYNCEKTESSS